jgi:hypothetical protein
MKWRRAKWWDPRTWMAFAFWELRMTFTATGGENLSDWKAAVTMTVAEILTIAALLDAISVYIGHRLGDRSVILIVVGFVIASLNLRTALGKNKILNALRAQFEIYSLPARISGAIVVILLIVLSAIAAGLLGEAVSHLPH